DRQSTTAYSTDLYATSMGYCAGFRATAAVRNQHPSGDLNQGKLEIQMGRQTAVALSEDDEREFLRFLRVDAVVRVIQWTAPRPDQIFVSEFPRRKIGRQSFHLWNTAFRWEPEFGQWNHVQDPNLAGQYYVKNRFGAPLIEYTREPFENPKSPL